MSEEIGFDYGEESEVTEFLPKGTYQAEIVKAEYQEKTFDDGNTRKSINIQVKISDIPDWGDSTEYINLTIPDGVENKRTQSFYYKRMRAAVQACKLSGVKGMSYDQLAEAMVGHQVMVEVEAPYTSKNNGQMYQNINFV